MDLQTIIPLVIIHKYYNLINEYPLCDDIIKYTKHLPNEKKIIKDEIYPGDDEWTRYEKTIIPKKLFIEEYDEWCKKGCNDFFEKSKRMGYHDGEITWVSPHVIRESCGKINLDIINKKITNIAKDLYEILYKCIQIYGFKNFYNYLNSYNGDKIFQSQIYNYDLLINSDETLLSIIKYVEYNKFSQLQNPIYNKKFWKNIKKGIIKPLYIKLLLENDDWIKIYIIMRKYTYGRSYTPINNIYEFMNIYNLIINKNNFINDNKSKIKILSLSNINNDKHKYRGNFNSIFKYYFIINYETLKNEEIQECDKLCNKI